MTSQISRRKALGALGGVSLAALLAACERSDDAVTSTDVATTTGATSTVEPQTSSSTALADLFDGAASCTLTPEETEGPYYFDVDSIRSDIREDREGTTLRLAVRVQDDAACTPLPNAVVDVWHCDAGCLYSGFESASTGGAGGGGRTDEEPHQPRRRLGLTEASGAPRSLRQSAGEPLCPSPISPTSTSTPPSTRASQMPRSTA